MIRFSLTMSILWLGSLLAPVVAIGQDSTKERPLTGKTADQAVETRAPTEAAEARPGADSASDKFKARLLDTFAEHQQEFPASAEVRARALASTIDALETNFGLSLSEADDTLRAQLEIPQGQGVVVVGVKGASLAENAGLKTNDVLLNLGGQDAREVEQVRRILLGLGKEALEVKLIRQGKPSRMSLVGPEHGFPPESAEYWIGVPVSPVDATLRAHLTSLPAESGLIVNDVVKGSPADQVAVKKDDILVTMDGKSLKNSDALIAQIQASQGKPVPLQVLRAGKPLTITITPAKRAHPTVINLKRNPDSLFTYQVVRPNLAIEVDPRSSGHQVGQEKSFEWKHTPQGSYTLIAPYSGMVLDPYAGVRALSPNASLPMYLNQLTPLPNTVVADPATARIEAQLKEVKAKLEEIAKTLEGLRKSGGK